MVHRAVANRIVVFLLSAGICCSAVLAMAAQPSKQPRGPRTAIKHLIVVVGENHSFDNVFATYIPPGRKQKVWNLLSLGIVNQFGIGANAGQAAQNQATDTDVFRLAPSQTGAFPTLVQPSTTLSALPDSPCSVSKFLIVFGANPANYLFCTDSALEPDDQTLLSIGGSGQSIYFPTTFYPVPDCRYPSDLPNSVFSIVGSSQLNSCPAPFVKPQITPTQYTDNVGDPVHRFFQMWQQNDCDMGHASASNPSGCLHDLYAWVATSVGWQITKDGKPPTDQQGTFQGGVAMGYYNMATGDFPYFRWLAQNYAISDNYHQFAMGGTGPNSQAIGTADMYYFTSGGVAAEPPQQLIEDPDPQAGSNNFYSHAGLGTVDPGNTSLGGLVKCANAKEPGVKAIKDYLNSLPYRAFNNGNCRRGHYYQVDNEYPSYDRRGNPIQKGNEFPAGPDFAIGPQTVPNIGQTLSAAGISWKYYGGGFNLASEQAVANTLYCAICNPFQYSQAVMTGPLKDNLKDSAAFFKDVSTGKLPAVTFLKPDVLLDGHPGSSTPALFEAFVRSVIDAVQRNRSLWKDTAILITFDESGGSYDSGYIQPIDFFGDGPRTVMIAVSPYAKYGYVDHTYADHASIVKFIEYNWRLKTLSARSRDNLPNPISDAAAPYFPTNSPAIGDLTGMFNFN